MPATSVFDNGSPAYVTGYARNRMGVVVEYGGSDAGEPGGHLAVLDRVAALTRLRQQGP